jgi:hypothetical protein
MLADLPSGFDSIQLWEANVQQDQVWSQVSGLLDRCQTIRHFTQHLKVLFLL